MKSPFLSRNAQIEELPSLAQRALRREGWRFGHMTARRGEGGELLVEVLLLNAGRGGGEILSAPVPAGVDSYPSVTPVVPAAHWAERALADFFGLEAKGHPRWKSLILHSGVWPDDLAPLRDGARTTASRGFPPASGNHAYAFLKVHGEGVHEIPVGPIHAGIIEPGHFRFSCLGEIVTNLEIRLGYQHRGIERELAAMPWQRARYLAESASSDTAAGNALAHAVAIEQLLDLEVPPRAQALRTCALELERLANHLGDMAGLSADIGYSPGASFFARLRGSALGLCELLTGTRLGRWYIVPGGVARDLARSAELARNLAKLAKEVRRYLPLILENSSVLDRMEGTGRLAASLAAEFGLVGPAARASGVRYDARTVYPHGVYPERAPTPAVQTEGDVLARARVRAEEIHSSLDLLARLVETLPSSAYAAEAGGRLAPESVGLGVVEAWRGELIHWITTDRAGKISRYAIKDPSFNNWTGLAIAVRGNLVADFPLCNKSFNLSYSGNDL